MKTYKVIVIYHYVAHYRRAIFEVLCGDQIVDYYIAADDKSNIGSLKVLNSNVMSCGLSISKKWRLLENKWITRNILWQKGLIQLVLSKKFDDLIFLGNMYFISTWWAVILAKFSGKKIYFWTHGFRQNEIGLKGWLRNTFYNLADGVFLYGNRSKKIMIDRGFDQNKLHVIYNSIDFDYQSEIFNNIVEEEIIKKKESLDIKPVDKVVISTGRLTNDKRYDLLIEALAEYKSRVSVNIKLILVGEGPEENNLRELVNDNALEENVNFYGSCYEEPEIGLLISMADISVVPGDIGLSAIHALTYGTPVITHDNFDTHKPEFEAIIDGETGAFFKYGSVTDLVDKISFWVRKDKEMSIKDCRQIISKFYNANYQKNIINQVITQGHSVA